MLVSQGPQTASEIIFHIADYYRNDVHDINIDSVRLPNSFIYIIQNEFLTS